MTPGHSDDEFPVLVHRAGAGAGAVEVWEHRGVRWLQFTNGPVQSEMHLDRPHALTLAYTRTMAAALLFLDAPRRVTLLGLGGGSLARFLLHHHPGARVVAIERDPEVARAAAAHFGLDADAIGVHVADAAAPGTDLGAPADLLAVDVFEPDGLPAWMHEERVHARFRAALAPGGVLVANLWVADDDEFLSVMAGMRMAFEGRVLISTVEGYRNLVVFAFARAPARLHVAALRERAGALSERFGFDVAATVDALERCNPTEDGVLLL